MNNALYFIGGSLLLLTPIFLLVGLIKPKLFARIIKGTPRRLPILGYSLILVVLSVTLIAVFEPASVKHAREVKQQQTTLVKKQPQPKAEPQVTVTKVPKPATTPSPTTASPHKKVSTAVYISHVTKTKNGYIVTGHAAPGALVEIQTSSHEKIKATADAAGSYKTATVKKMTPVGTLSVSTLKKSFASYKATERQKKYYSLFSSTPKLSDKSLGAVITKSKPDGSKYQIEGFYLPKKVITVTYDNKVIAKTHTNEDGFYVISSLKKQADTMKLALVSDGTTIAATYLYTPSLALYKAAPTVKTETRTEPVPFTSSTKEDSSLTKGATRVSVTGQNGVKTYTYLVTYAGSAEINRKLTSESVTTAPVNEVTLLGTYVAPAPVYTYTAPTSTVPSSGATAKCVDGTLSYSAHRQGTCSHHGGVAIWY